jgi:hypothetical protein
MRHDGIRDNEKNPKMSMGQNRNKKRVNMEHTELAERAPVNWNVIKT